LRRRPARVPYTTLFRSMVALVQTATSLPVFFLALPAGALADVVDRRRLLLLTQSWMLLMAMMLGALTLLNLATPWTLLLLTFSLDRKSTRLNSSHEWSS